METIRRDAELCHSQVLSFIDTLEQQLLQTEASNTELDTQSSKLLADITKGIEEGLLANCERLSKSLDGISNSMPELRQRIAAVREMRQTMEALLDKLSLPPRQNSAVGQKA
jgi:hypothetical protein